MSHQSELISQDILGYLKQHENKDLLRFLTCGNVDDGKSTLIGRLLYDSKLIYEDQLQAVTRDSKKVGTTGDAPDLHSLSMVYKLNVSRVLPLMWLIVISQLKNVSSSLLTRQDMSNTRVTWQQVRQPVILRLF
jgi:hypothetical protein